jgi:hypothetical protein
MLLWWYLMGRPQWLKNRHLGSCLTDRRRKILPTKKNNSFRFPHIIYDF